jgi:hypothetical protein
MADLPFWAKAPRPAPAAIEHATEPAGMATLARTFKDPRGMSPSDAADVGRRERMAFRTVSRLRIRPHIIYDMFETCS